MAKFPHSFSNILWRNLWIMWITFVENRGMGCGMWGYVNKSACRGRQITKEAEQPDGSILVRVRKQYNDKADVKEYFE